MTLQKFVPFSLAIFLVFLFDSPVKAQVHTNTAILQKAARETAIQEKADLEKLLIISKQKGWPLSITNKKGRHAILSGIDPRGLPLYVGVNDLGSAASIKTNLVWPGGSTGLNLTGSSINMKDKLAIWDEDSVRGTHQELVNRILQKDRPATESDHSTHVAGIMMAAGINPGAKGMAYGLPRILAYDFINHLSEMLTESPNLLVSNHSYGTISGWNFNEDQNRWEFWGNAGDTADYKFGYYSTEAQVWDSIAYNAPNYLIVKSGGNNRDVNGPAVGQPYWRYNANGVMINAGNRPNGISSNNGYDIIPTYGTAKNILTIGAANPVPGGYTQPSDVILSTFSSWGPTDDGRIKPDLVTDGVDVLSSIAASNDAYAIFSGTSMSSPAAAGSSMLLQEHYSKTHGGAFMRSATLKGLLIHTADETGISPGPDYQYGWGLINMQKAAAVITSNNTDQLINEGNLVNGATFDLPIVASGKGPLVATICWTDPAASVDKANLLNNPARKLVNDLDMRIVSTDSTYQPWILNPAQPSLPATNGDNVLDNVEKIEVNNLVPGKSYTIHISHKGTLARGQQAFSLLVSGVGGQTYCASGPASNGGTRIDSVGIGSFHHSNPAGCTTYTDLTGLTVPVQTDQTIPFSIRVTNCDGTAVGKIVKIFIDYNNNGTFTDPGENVAVSGQISGAGGTFSGTFTTPAGLVIGNFTRMRIIAQETTDPATVTPCGTYGNGETQDYRVQIAQPSNDVGISQILDPQVALCVSDSQRVTVRVKNFGTNMQLNVPITATVKQNGTVISTQTLLCPDTLPAQGSVVYTFQAPFAVSGGSTYTITAATNLAGDQDGSNDQDTATSVVLTDNNTPTGTAEICGTEAVLKANVDSNNVAFWYNSSTATKPVAVGNITSTTVIPGDKTYYLALNDLTSSKVGPPSKSAFPSGGYNEFSGNFVKFTNTVPLTIHSARLYIAHGGKIQFIVGDIVNYKPSDGSFSYFPISSTTLDVYPTTPNPQGGQIDANIASDTGAVYYLNLQVPVAGNHAIIIDCQDGANIYRNNNINSNPYPFSIPGVFAITGNSAVNTNNTSDTTFYRRYYYFFYNMEIELQNCPGPRAPVVASTATIPVITLSGNTFSSNIATGNQWYLNDTAIAGATGQTQTAGLPGIYSDTVTDAKGCILGSNKIVYTAGSDIGLIVGPNPNNGVFNVQFFVAKQANVDLSLMNTLGQKLISNSYPNFSGGFSTQIAGQNLAAGVYFLRVQVGGKSYIQKILVR